MEPLHAMCVFIFARTRNGSVHDFCRLVGLGAVIPLAPEVDKGWENFFEESLRGPAPTSYQELESRRLREVYGDAIPPTLASMDGKELCLLARATSQRVFQDNRRRRSRRRRRRRRRRQRQWQPRTSPNPSPRECSCVAKRPGGSFLFTTASRRRPPTLRTSTTDAASPISVRSLLTSSEPR